MAITKDQQRALKAKAHSLKPIILLGQKGLTDAVMVEINAALEYHELIKIKLAGAERDDRQALATAICEQTHADQVGIIGQILIAYRPNLEKQKKAAKAAKAAKTTKSKSKRHG